MIAQRAFSDDSDDDDPHQLSKLGPNLGRYDIDTQTLYTTPESGHNNIDEGGGV